MKHIPIFLFAVAIAMSSCSSAYKTSQTPDDVYYSPGQQRSSSDNYSNNNRSSNSNNDQDEYYNANPNDQYLAMKVQDPQRWSTFDDYGNDAYYPSTIGYGYGLGSYYGGMYSPFMGYGLGFGFGNPYFGYDNSYYGWNAFYNPYYYYGNVAYVGGKGSAYNTYTSVHPFNAAAYRNSYISNRNSRSYSPNGNGFNNRNGNSYVSPNTATRRTFYNSPNNNNLNNNSNRTFTQPTRTYSPAPASSGGGGGSRGSFSRPGRP